MTSARLFIESEKLTRAGAAAEFPKRLNAYVEAWARHTDHLP